MKHPLFFYSVLSLAALLCSTAIAQKSSTDKHFVIIGGSGEAANLVEPLPATALFTPNESGLYRISVYVEIVGLSSTSVIVVPYMNWTDDSMTAQFDSNVVTGPGGNSYAVSGSQANVNAGGVTVLRALANTPVMLHIDVDGAFAAGVSYSLYVTVERLSPRSGSN